MELRKNLNYMIAAKLLFRLLELDKLTEEEHKKACRRLAEIYRPDPEYIR